MYKAEVLVIILNDILDAFTLTKDQPKHVASPRNQSSLDFFECHRASKKNQSILMQSRDILNYVLKKSLYNIYRHLLWT